MRRILIVHYHLNPGGVTRVIESQVQSLRIYDPTSEILVLTASCPEPEGIEKAGAKLILEKKLNYLPEQSDFRSEYTAIKKIFGEILKHEDILHVHNLNLGKNPALTLVVSEFAIKGYRVINHAHDFAEDRPANMRFMNDVIARLSKIPVPTILYNDLPDFFHIVLNSTDKKRLLAFGVREEKIVVLPNPVVFSSYEKSLNSSQNRASIAEKLDLNPEKKWVTYPVRVIRRKNIGEYILLCLLFKADAEWLVTQPPKNPSEIKYYCEWKEFCSNNHIPVRFVAGNQVDFESLIVASDCCFTTSTMEGFGMVFLEPWLLGTPVIGRNLPNVTSDLKQTGIEFPMLYNSIEITWEGSDTDFCRLSMSEQMKYIAGLIQNPQTKNEIYRKNSFLEKLLISVDQPLIDKNKTIILQEFSLENYAKRLKKIYQRLTG